jgi:Transposase DDE domain
LWSPSLVVESQSTYGGGESNFGCGPTDSEQKLVEQLWDRIPADALLIEDRGFFSYDHWKALDARGVKLLIRVQSNLILRAIQRLPDGSYLAKIYPSSYHCDKDRDGIVVRVIEYTLDDPQRTGHGETHRLMTNLFDPESFPALELACYYHERREEELVFDEQRLTSTRVAQARRRTFVARRPKESSRSCTPCRWATSWSAR